MTNLRQGELALAVIFIALTLSGCGKVVAKAQETQNPTRKNIELTVYKEDFGVVKEDRPMSLAAGTNRVGLLDISKTLDQDSVMFKWPAAAQGTKVASSTYDLGIGDNSSLLKRFLGKPVDIVHYGQDGKESERLHGVLEVADQAETVVDVDGKYVINPQGNIEAPNSGIVTIPQLSAEVNSPSQQNTDLDVTYLTRGLSWSADYVATLDPNSDDLNLEVWASITNLTGVDFPDAKIGFVAGSPNRSSAPAPQNVLNDDVSLAKASREAQHAAIGGVISNTANLPQAAGELYEYPMKTTATIAQNQSNRVRMFYSEKVGVHKDYSVRLPYLASYGLTSDYGQSDPDHRYSATLAVSFKDTKENGLGVPLPSGAVRVYESGKSDSSSLKYVGAGAIPDTPQKAGVYLTLSNVFDVYGQCKVLSSKRVDKHTVLKEMEISAHSEKASPIDLRVVENMEGNWKIVSESEKSKKLDASTAQWTLHLGAGAAKTLKVSVQFKA